MVLDARVIERIKHRRIRYQPQSYIIRIMGPETHSIKCPSGISPKALIFDQKSVQVLQDVSTALLACEQSVFLLRSEILLRE